MAGKWLAVAAVVTGGFGVGAALYEPGVTVTQVPVGRLEGGSVVPGVVTYVHASRWCRLASTGAMSVPAAEVPADAAPCPVCGRL